MHFSRMIVLCLLLAGVGQASASSMKQEFHQCLTEVERITGINRAYILSIKIVESGTRLGPVVRRNPNGTEDIGIFQINSAWLPDLRAHGISRGMLFNNCTNMRVSAWILLTHLNRVGDIWEAVGRYHSATPQHKARYIRAVRRVFRQLTT